MVVDNAAIHMCLLVLHTYFIHFTFNEPFEIKLIIICRNHFPMKRDQQITRSHGVDVRLFSF